MIHGLYLVLDPSATHGRPPRAVAEAALRGGVHAVQWRQKTGSWTAAWPQLLAVRDLCREGGVPFLVNDRVDVALAVGAAGAHLGQDDLPAAAARDLLPNGILGVSITELAQVDPATEAGADYLGVGPIFTTDSKPDAAPALGLDGLRAVRARTALPIVAIGGITLSNAPDVVAAGADSLAVISALCAAEDVEAAARTLVQAFNVRVDVRA